MLMVVTLALEAFGMIGGGVATALALSWLVFRLGVLARRPVAFVIAAGAIAALTVADVFACGTFPRISAAFALPMRLLCWVEARGWQQASVARRQI